MWREVYVDAAFIIIIIGHCGSSVVMWKRLDWFVVINRRVLPANRVDFGLLFFFHKISFFTPPPPPQVSLLKKELGGTTTKLANEEGARADAIQAREEYANRAREAEVGGGLSWIMMFNSLVSFENSLENSRIVWESQYFKKKITDLDSTLPFGVRERKLVLSPSQRQGMKLSIFIEDLSRIYRGFI